MALSNELITQFVKATKDEPETKKETTVYGTVVTHNGVQYVKLDGSELLTPISTTANVLSGERVTVMIKNHTATVTGNISSPAARVGDVSDIKDAANKIVEFEIILSGKVDAETLNAEIARIDGLVSDNITVKETLSANEAIIKELQAHDVTVDGTLTANSADIDSLKANKLDVEVAEATYATIENLDATNADIYNLTSTYGDFVDLTTDKFTAVTASIDSLEADKLDATAAEVTYANIDFSNIGKAAMEYFYANSGLIENVVVNNGTITGNLIGVTIKGDLIEAGTLVADKLVILGTDGLYYKLNTNGVTTEAEQTEYNSLNGKIILAKSVTAEKISVDDLVAFDATIGGFNITDGSIYSGAKSGVSNTTRGIYLDNTGQVAFGDSSNYIKYYKDSDGIYKLAIAAESIVMGSGTSVDSAINEVLDAANAAQASVDNLEIGGRNLLLNTGGDDPIVMSNGGVYAASGITNITNSNGVFTLECDATTAEIYYRFMSPSLSTTNLYGLEPGKTYTLSGKVQVTTTSGTLVHLAARTQECISGWSGGINRGITTVDTDDWLEFECPFTIGTNAAGYYVSFQLTYTDSWKGVIVLTNLKLERGDRASDWTPAPEDMATNANLSAVENRVTSAEARIIVNSEGVSQVAARTTENETTIATLKLTADGLTARIDTTDKNLTDLTVGGRNLLKNTKSFTGINYGNGAIQDEKYKDFTVRYLDYSSADTTTYTEFAHYSQAIVPEGGASYTFSFYAKGSGKLKCHFYNGGFKTVKCASSQGVSNTSSDGGIDITLSDEWVRHWVTYTLEDTNTQSSTANKNVLLRVWGGNIAYVCACMFEQSNKASNWAPAPEDVDADISNASKTATNYMNFSTSGLTVGDLTASTLKNNVLIGADRVDIRNGSTVLASYGDDEIILGQNAEGSTISLCDGAGSITALVSESSDSSPKFDSIQLESQKLVLNGKRIYNNTAGSNSTHSNTADMEAISYVDSAGAVAALRAETTVTSSGDVTLAGVQSLTDASSTATRTRVYSEFVDNSAGTTTSNSIYVYPTVTELTKPLKIQGITLTGANKVLWSGASQMTASHTATLSEAVSKQPNGIVLVFSEYADSAVSNTAFHHRFIPKHQVANHSGTGVCIQLSTSNLAYFGTKYLYISDTTVKGNDNNTLTGSSTCGITRTCNRFCLRYVIGI